MKFKKLGVGIIGCGKAGKYHAYWYSKNPNCNLVGFYNRTKLKAIELSRKYGGKVYDEWADLLKDKKIDIVSICTPSIQHRDQVCLALELNKHVLCEKPMAGTSRECRDMINLSEKSKANLGVFFNMRFHPVTEAVNKNIERIGELLSIDMSFQFFRKDRGWRGQLDSNTGVLMELGVHAVDLAIYWFGDVGSVKGEVLKFKENSQCDDHVYAVFKFNKNKIGKLYTSYNDPGFYDELIEGLIVQILGRSGKICFLLNSYDPKRNRVFIIEKGEKEEIDLRKSSECDKVYPGHMDSFGRLINGFIYSIIEKKKFEPSGIDGLKTIKFVEDVYKSSGWEQK